LWGSTSTKNPQYPDTLYVDQLIGPETVNTTPLPTLEAFLDHGQVAVSLDCDPQGALHQLERLAELGVDLDDITDRLLADGVEAFSDSFESLIDGIAQKREELTAASARTPALMAGGGQFVATSLGAYQAAVDQAVDEMSRNQVVSRIWQRDHTLWKPEPTEITNRLGWLDGPQAIQADVPHMEAFAEQVRADGYTDVLVLGMGGSSLAPELFQGAFGAAAGGLTLSVLDSTVPEAVLDYADRLNLARTLFIVSSKSGTTVETLSFFKFFYNRAMDALGKKEAGQHFVSITDEGTYLAKLAKQFDFRASFLNDPNIGGRYSALSFFGLVPAALVGVELPRLLARAQAMARASQVPGEENPALQLGAILSELAKQGRDKATFIVSSTIGNLGDWIEQLIAESTGKEGRGILPVVKEPFGLPDAYGADRLFIYIRRDEQPGRDQDNLVQAYENAGFPLVRLHVQDVYDLGGQFFLWEMATAVAGHRLGINPFDQPDVEAAKARARDMVKRYTETGSLPHEEPGLIDQEMAVYGSWPARGEAGAATGEGAVQALRAFVSQGQPGDYVALQAYLQPTVQVEAALRSLAARIRDETRLATTVGYGPRYLHSTGQLHKGDAGRGLFVQFTADDQRDAPIPDQVGSPEASLSFGVLKTAQALGDRQALLDAGRRVIRFHLGTSVIDNLNRLGEALAPRAAAPTA
jgi:glucose-6-phosphate isomerase